MEYVFSNLLYLTYFLSVDGSRHSDSVDSRCCLRQYELSVRERTVVRDSVFVYDVANAFRMVEAIIGYLSACVYAIGSGAGTCLAGVVYLFSERVESSSGFHPVVMDAEPPSEQGMSDLRSFECGSMRLRGATGLHVVVPLCEEIDLTIGSNRGHEGFP